MTTKPALTLKEWQECQEIERSGNDPLSYIILASPERAMCWINGNLLPGDPKKFNGADLVLTAIRDNDLDDDGGATIRLNSLGVEKMRQLHAKLAAIQRPV